MSKEKKMIQIINSQMPRGQEVINRPFECDAEILRFHSTKLAYNIDEFSEEDFLRENDPYILGWNMAVGCISDIFASGGIPKFYAHSLVINPLWSNEYVEELSKGIAKVLRNLQMSFIGGDFGKSEKWRYTGSVIGELQGDPLLRSNAKVGEDIFISGQIGLGNIEAALKIYENKGMIKSLIKNYKNRFRLRNKEATLIKKYSCCCIDTSDGVFNAINNVSQESNVGFRLENLPYEKNGILLSKVLNIPRELLFLGECGEYELLFTIKKEVQKDFLEEAKNQGLLFYKIGKIEKKGIKVYCEKGAKIDLGSYDLSARSEEDVKEYLRKVVDFVKTRRGK